jgi:IS30 family transposase
MCHYTHLTPFEREKILFFLAEGKSVTEIAHLLNWSKSTISRELRRNVAGLCRTAR